ncbi:MAG: prephenate dehydrogenase/arogenate dehydrogenase family protein [Dehalococcoidia bacterium]|nr:prephenate dehydrogenase/arogenate dehydrogenase family protein [Dehalococcoidia bacterium]
MKKIAIIGLGLIGGSIGLALRAADIKGVRVVGYSRRPESAAKARRRGAVGEVAGSLASGVDGASLVILATPVAAMEAILKEIGPVLQKGALVTDTASTKATVMKWAAESLPEGVSFVGGHPMAGKEIAGIEAAEGSLFRGCTYCLCPDRRAAPDAVEAVVGLVNLLGASPYFVDPTEHDSYVAAISHLPMLVSTALVAATAGSPAWREMSRLASTGYRDTTRLASSDPVMSRDIYRTNQQSLDKWLDVLIRELETLRKNIADGGPELEAKLRQIKDARDRWQIGEPLIDSTTAAEPLGGWGHLLFGKLPSLLSASGGRKRI